VIDPVLASTLHLFENKRKHHKSHTLSNLRKARETLSSSYKEKTSQPPKQGFLNEEERLSYILSRFPATYAACKEVLKNLPNTFSFESFLDIGCGPGTASLSILSIHPELKEITLIDNDKWMLNLAKESLTYQKQKPNLIHGHIAHLDFPEKDLVILSYVLTEFPSHTQLDLLKKAWNASKKGLVIVIPGALRHFDDFIKVRSTLIAQGAYIAAPCPNTLSCPMEGTKDWCHFKARTSRTSSQRALKGAHLNYEDEPYSYLIATREFHPPLSNRIVKRPQEKSGHVIFHVCEEEKIQTKIISRKDKNYKEIKKLRLGESIPGFSQKDS